MVDTKVVPAYLLNNYVWELLKNNTTMTTDDYEGMVPIIMSEQEPEIDEYNKPFLVYGYSEDPTKDLYMLSSGTLAYAVYSTDGGEVTDILNIIREALKRFDESARSINGYLSSLPTQYGVRFRATSIGLYQGPQPERSEGGRKQGIITIRFSYVDDYDQAVKVYTDTGWA